MQGPHTVVIHDMSPRDRNQLGSPLSGYDCTSRRAELVVPAFDALPAYETDIVGLQLCFKGGGFGFQVMRTVSVKGVLIVAAEIRFVLLERSRGLADAELKVAGEEHAITSGVYERQPNLGKNLFLAT